MHSWRARRRGLGWIGIALILLNLCAPTLTHALQLGQRAALLAPAHDADWCGSLAAAPTGSSPAQTDGGAPDSAARHAPACGFCAQVSLSWAPPPTAAPRALPPAAPRRAPPDAAPLRSAAPTPGTALPRAPPLALG